MDIDQIIGELHEERDYLDEVIRSLEAMPKTSDPDLSRLGAPRRRGRKSMSQAERAAVSRRMRKYWEKRRKE